MNLGMNLILFIFHHNQNLSSLLNLIFYNTFPLPTTQLSFSRTTGRLRYKHLNLPYYDLFIYLLIYFAVVV
jgi:hypothetical protein